MVKVRGVVEGGRLKIDAVVDLPENTEVDLVALPVDPDDLDETDRRLLHEAIEQGDAELERGEGIPAARVLAELRALTPSARWPREASR